MIKNGLIRETRAVSPVVGVVLLIGITVILAATIATLVFGLGVAPTVAPNVDWRFDYDENGENLTITHVGGDPVDANELYLTGEALESELSLADIGPERWTVATSATVDIDLESSDGTVVLVWRGETGEGTIMAEWRPPTG